MQSSLANTQVVWQRLAQFRRDYLPGDTFRPAVLPESFQIYQRHAVRCRRYVPPSRSDYFKLTLVTAGTGRYHYGGQCYAVAAPALLLTVPERVKAWEATSDEQEGIFCVFTEDFLGAGLGAVSVAQLPLFAATASPVVPLPAADVAPVQRLFEAMQAEYHGEHADRAEAIRLHLRLLLLAAGRLAGAAAAPAAPPVGSAAALTDRFLAAVRQQFPLLHPDATLALTSAAQFADALAVHPTYLNACVKRTTGRTVTEHLREHTLREAARLLTYTTWPVGWVAAALGFHDAAYFARVFHRHTGRSPRAHRQQA